MPSSKEALALRWAQASEEEKCEKRRRHADAQKRYREKKAKKERSDMKSEEIDWKRALDRKNQKNRRMNMTKEQKDSIRAKDREQKAKKRREKKKDGANNKISYKKGTSDKNNDLHSLEKKRLKQLKYMCMIDKKKRNNMTDEDTEKHNANLAERLRAKRSMMKEEGKILALIKANTGMKLCRKFGYLRKYKQRKCRDEYDASCYATIGVNRNGYSKLSWYYNRQQEKIIRRYREKQEKDVKISKQEYCQKIKENSKENNKKEKLKSMNRIRVQRYRRKVKKMLQEPLILDDNSHKGPYELLREKNIREFEKLKKESGLFD